MDERGLALTARIMGVLYPFAYATIAAVSGSQIISAVREGDMSALIAWTIPTVLCLVFLFRSIDRWRRINAKFKRPH
jgi:hypothetical protein